jgi:hypothetical protein
VVKEEAAEATISLCKTSMTVLWKHSRRVITGVYSVVLPLVIATTIAAAGAAYRHYGLLIT